MSTDPYLPIDRTEKSFFWALFIGYNQYWLGEFMFFVVLCPGAPEGSTRSGSGFKASQKTGPQLKSLIQQT